MERSTFFEVNLLESGIAQGLPGKIARLRSLEAAGIRTEEITALTQIEAREVELYRSGRWGDLSRRVLNRLESEFANAGIAGYKAIGGRPSAYSPITTIDVEARLVESGLATSRARREASKLMGLNEQGVSTSEIAACAGVPLHAVSNYRYGRWRSMSKAHREEIEQALGVLKVKGYSTREERKEKKLTKSRCEYLAFHKRGMKGRAAKM